jgi:cyclophilin family peptidyl-prolyl cis-trans isomerase
MTRILRATAASLLLAALAPEPDLKAAEVSLCTDLGNIVLEVDEENAPLHAANFLRYVDRGHYSGTVFHRVIDGFMIQGGGYDRQLLEKETLAPIDNESRNGLSNERGSLAAARTSDPHSATAQFYINLVDNAQLDGTPENWGYTVFGLVLSGMDVVDAIADLPTRGLGRFPTDVPEPLVAVTSAARLDRQINASMPAQNMVGRALAAMQAGDYATALTWFDHYRATCATRDAEFLLAEAETASGLDRNARAKASLNEFFLQTGDSHERYEFALELFGDVAPGEQPTVSMSFGDCSSPEAPEVPDGSVADREAMLLAQAAVQSYMRDTDTYLECLDELIEGRDTSEPMAAAATSAYNQMVDAAQALGDRFNAQVRAFRARE